MQDFEGKVAVVTGGASGIGMAERFAAAGSRIPDASSTAGAPSIRALWRMLGAGHHQE